MLRLSAILTFVALSACSYQPAPCRADNVLVNLQGNAGCWLVKEGKVLLIVQRNGLVSFPGGTAESGETAQCTAHRETLEEAGVDVRVGRLKYRFDNGFYLFHCKAEQFPLETKDPLEIAEVILADPLTLAADQWRFPEQRQLTIEWLNEYAGGR